MKKRRGQPVEWVGGNMMMPAAADDPEIYETFFWLDAHGDLLGTATYVARDMPDRLADSYVATTESPEVGEPHVPARIRVASEAHAAALREAVGPETEVVCAPTPEIEPVRISLAAYLDKVGSQSEEEESYLSSGVDAATVASLFRAAAALYVVAPWRTLPNDEAIAAVSIRALGVRNGTLVVFGREGGCPGIQVFPDQAGAEEYRRLTVEPVDPEEGDGPIPPHIGLELTRGADLDPGQRKEISKHGWKVAGPVAYPEISAFDEDGMLRRATGREHAVLEAVATALVEVVEKHPAVARAIADGKPFEHSVDVETSRGKVTVALSDLDAVEEDDADREEEARAEDERILDRFEASPEYARIQAPNDWAALMLEHTHNTFGVGVTDLTPMIVEETVFESFPEKVACPPEVARSIVDEMRAFFAFLEREGHCPDAASCGRLFDEKAERTLEERLSDPRNFGMTKTMMIAGIEAGYDLSTEEGMAAWLGKANDMLLGDGPASASASSKSSPSRPSSKSSPSSASARRPPSDPAKKAKRKKQKASRASRKKSR